MLLLDAGKAYLFDIGRQVMPQHKASVEWLAQRYASRGVIFTQIYGEAQFMQAASRHEKQMDDSRSSETKCDTYLNRFDNSSDLHQPAGILA